MQSTKFIDLRRTYVPINANTFPVSMHGTSSEDAPENRIPVMAYEGKNFLPTAHGYKSYFGTTGEVGIDALGARVDFVFVYQNLTFENVLIALSETGVWIKKANVLGAWTNTVPIVPPIDPTVHYEWTYVVIANVLYVYRQNYASYQKIISDVTLGVAITSVVPNTLNMAGQMGIFRAGGRLGYWDSDDSVSWSNQDDYADFVTSILTFAGSAKFIDVNGRIVVIKGHGPGFMIYCTKSIIYVEPAKEATFQWQPQVIFNNNGIQYSRQCVSGTPDTTHFAYTSEGLFKIENAQEEALVPEVTDTLATHEGPVYLSISEGRYLYLEVLDPNFLNSLVQFTEGTTGEDRYYFPGANVPLADAIAEEILNGTNMCATISGVDAGLYSIIPPAEWSPFYRPRWLAYLSNSGSKDGSIPAWSGIPVATIDPNGLEVNQCPAAGTNKTSQLTTNATNKTAVTGAAAYVDGIWTIERFVATQTALWEMEAAASTEYLETLLNRTNTRTKSTVSEGDGSIPIGTGSVTLTVSPTDRQLIGQFGTEFTPGQFGFSACEFWLTRYAVKASNVYRLKYNRMLTTDGATRVAPAGYSPDVFNGGGDPNYSMHATPQAAALYGGGDPGQPYFDDPTDGYGTDTYHLVGADGKDTWFKQCGGQSKLGGGAVVVWAVYKQPAGYRPMVINTTPSYTPLVNHVVTVIPTAGRFSFEETMVAINVAEEVILTPTPDTGYCTIVGYDYTDLAGNPQFAAAAACALPAAYPPGSAQREAPFGAAPVVGGDGSFCGMPFEPVTISPEPGVIAYWPDTTVVLPAGTFLLQDGSIAPVYPTFYGALVYDLRLKKWGNYQGQYKALLNYSPINNSDTGIIPYSVFGILGGMLDAAGKVRLFDSFPSDSYLTFGKIGYYRGGMTSCEEVIAHFSSPSTGELRVDTSLSGRFVDVALNSTEAFTDAKKVRLTGSYPGNWQNVTIRGIYDLSYLEYRGKPEGRR